MRHSKAQPAAADELAAFATVARETLARHWTGPAGGTAELRGLWSAACEQGWMELGALGAFSAAVTAARELGRAGCPLPVVDAYVATRLFDDEELAASVSSGEVRVVAAVADPGPDLVRHVDAADAATHMLLIPVAGGRAELRTLAEVRATPGMAAPTWSEVVPGELTAAAELTPEEADEAVVLLRLQLAARALSAAEHSHEMAVEHAKQRSQFGKVIGSFGAVQQRVAACQIEVSAGRLLLDDAVSALEAGAPQRLLAAELATSHVRGTAAQVQLGAHHTLAAIGYFEEHPAPWLFRRVNADVARLRDLPRRAGEIADVFIEDGGSLPPSDLGEAGENLRTAVRELLAGHREKLGGAMTDEPELVGAFRERGWLGFAWPESVGGRNATTAEQVVLNEEVSYHRAPVNRALGAVMLLGESIVKHGSEAQKEKFLPLIRRGELSFCLGYSEPEAGSDLASLRTRAVPDGDDWVINGQKLWSTGAHESDWVWLATRTDPDAEPRHAGITVFLVPMDTPGITVQQHRALSGEISCSVFYDEVRVPDSARVGEVNGGWKVITDALAGERITMGNIAAALHRQLDDLLDVVRADPEGVAGPRGSAARGALTELATRVHANRALVASAIRATSGLDERTARLHAPMAGVMGGELAEQFGETTLGLLGPQAALSGENPGVPGGGAFEYGLRLSVMYVVGGGTNDVQRGLIARALGLPR